MKSGVGLGYGQALYGSQLDRLQPKAERQSAHIVCTLHAPMQVTNSRDALFHVTKTQLITHEATKASPSDLRCALG